jgi:hypothetical protein
MPAVCSEGEHTVRPYHHQTQLSTAVQYPSEYCRLPSANCIIDSLRIVCQRLAMVHLRFLIIGCLVVSFTLNGFVSENKDLRKSIQISAKPFINFDMDDPKRRFFGTLQFLGGLELSSSDRNFGGISALRVQNDGSHFLALSDRAYWLRGRIVYSGTKPTGLANTEMAPVLGPDGKHAKRWDTESLAEVGNTIYMGVEGLDRIPCFVLRDSKFPVYQKSIPFPAGLKNLPRNGGLEALEFIPKMGAFGDTLVALSENGLDSNGNMIAYCIDASVRKTFAVKRSGGYNISDAALLSDEHLLVLERKYEIMNGISMRIRKIPVASIIKDTVVDGPVVIEADMRCQIDNMEAMSVHHTPSGEAVLTLISDDNYSIFQRTLLLQFAYREP